jgi:RNase P/RNase MRP subunit p29
LALCQKQLRLTQKLADNAKENFIGKELKVISAANGTCNNIQGIIVDEKKNAFIVSVDGCQKTLLKQGNTFAIGQTIVDGNTIVKCPEERIKA